MSIEAKLDALIEALGFDVEETPVFLNDDVSTLDATYSHTEYKLTKRESPLKEAQERWAKSQVALQEAFACSSRLGPNEEEALRQHGMASLNELQDTVDDALGSQGCEKGTLLWGDIKQGKGLADKQEQEAIAYRESQERWSKNQIELEQTIAYNNGLRTGIEEAFKEIEESNLSVLTTL